MCIYIYIYIHTYTHTYMRAADTTPPHHLDFLTNSIWGSCSATWGSDPIRGDPNWLRGWGVGGRLAGCLERVGGKLWGGGGN